MSELVQRLSNGNHPLALRRTKNVEQLKDSLDRGHLLLTFTQTKGGTELGIRLDPAACDFSRADFARGAGSVHVEGDLKLDYVPVRLIADVALDTLQGTGCLKIRDVATP